MLQGGKRERERDIITRMCILSMLPAMLIFGISYPYVGAIYSMYVRLQLVLPTRHHHLFIANIVLLKRSKAHCSRRSRSQIVKGFLEKLSIATYPIVPINFLYIRTRGTFAWVWHTGSMPVMLYGGPIYCSTTVTIMSS